MIGIRHQPAPMLSGKSDFLRGQGFFDQGGERVYEVLPAVHCGHAPVMGQADFPGNVAVQYVQLIQRLNMFGDKADRDEQKLADALGRQPPYCLISGWAEPFHRSDLALKGERMWTAGPDAFHHQFDGAARLIEVWIAIVDIADRDAMSAEDQVSAGGIMVAVTGELLEYRCGKSIDIPDIVVRIVDYRDLDASRPPLTDYLVHPVQAGPGCGH